MRQKLKSNIKKYLPYMLRDNVAHPEKDKGHSKEKLWEARQDVIEDLQLVEIYDDMKSILNDFKNCLFGKRILHNR
jgi:hypothetical protein